MKAKVQKLIGTVALGLALSSHSLPACAGSIDLSEIEVGANYGKGTMAGARYSGDNQQYIGCSFSDNNGLVVSCSARDKTGRSFGCWSNDARFVDAAKAITDNSHLSFSSAPGATSCRDIIVTNSSSHLR